MDFRQYALPFVFFQHTGADLWWWHSSFPAARLLPFSAANTCQVPIRAFSIFPTRTKLRPGWSSSLKIAHGHLFYLLFQNPLQLPLPWSGHGIALPMTMTSWLWKQSRGHTVVSDHFLVNLLRFIFRNFLVDTNKVVFRIAFTQWFSKALSNVAECHRTLNFSPAFEINWKSRFLKIPCETVSAAPSGLDKLLSEQLILGATAHLDTVWFFLSSWKQSISFPCPVPFGIIAFVLLSSIFFAMSWKIQKTIEIQLPTQSTFDVSS